MIPLLPEVEVSNQLFPVILELIQDKNAEVRVLAVSSISSLLDIIPSKKLVEDITPLLTLLGEW